jgi:beta-barrel assembly-enhancing protease
LIGRAFIVSVLSATSLLSAAPAQAQGDADADALLALQAFDARVTTIGYRLATANLELCQVRQWLAGIALHDVSQYGGRSRAAAIRTFGLDSGPAVLALAAGGPAERAGLRINDVLLGLDGAPLPAAPRRRTRTYNHMERLHEALEAAFADGSADLSIQRSGQPMSISVAAEQGCATRFQTIPSRSPDARADGVYVQLHHGLANYVRDDQELAAVVAHEFSHNVLRHKARLDAQHEALGRDGRSSSLVRATEVEAERMSVHLLHRAGYDPEAAVRFWSHFGRRGLNFLKTPTHPSWRQRIALFQQEIAAIRAAEAAGVTPAPTFLEPSAAQTAQH